MKSSQYVAAYKMPMCKAYFLCNDAVQYAVEADLGFSLVPIERWDGSVLPAETFEYEAGRIRPTVHPLPALFVDMPRRTLVYPTHKVSMHDISGAPEGFVRGYLDEMSDYLALGGSVRKHEAQLRQANNDGTWRIKKF